MDAHADRQEAEEKMGEAEKLNESADAKDAAEAAHKAAEKASEEAHQ
jgi:hypothetical protein